MEPRVRPYRPADRAAVRAICFETGLMGDPIASVFGDRESFADVFTGYYTDHEPECCFVVEADGAVLGYLVGTLNARRAYSPERVLAAQALQRLLVLRPSTARFFWQAAIDMVRDGLAGEPRRRAPDLDRYPAHSHFSLLPEARRAPIAAGLYRAFFTLAKQRGCRGVHGEVFAENLRAAALHDAMGFRREGPATPAPGIRGLHGERLHVQLWVREL